jgi:hypothetical protein
MHSRLVLRIAYAAVSGRDYSVFTTVSPTLRAAGLSGKGQNTEHGCAMAINKKVSKNIAASCIKRS